MTTILAKAIVNIAEIKSGYIFYLRDVCSVNDWTEVNTIELGKAFRKLIEDCPDIGVVINTPNPTGTQDYRKL